MEYKVSQKVKDTFEALSSLESVKKGLEAIKKDQDRCINEQIELTLIEAPTFHEEKRAEVMKKKMEELGMVIDVSHANEKTFWDIVEIAKGPIIATHSNARRLCCHDRNLTDQQLKAIKAKGGIVGLNAARYFISDHDDQQDVAHLGAHGRYIADLIGCEHVAIGFDFMDFIPDHDNAMGKGLASAACAQNLIEALKAQGLDEKQCQMIAYENAIALLRRVLR